MGKRLFVGNLPFSATDDELRTLFAQHGTVTDVHIVIDRETNRSRGFGFVSYATDDEAQRATDALNGKPFAGRPLVVKDARDRGAPPAPGERPPRPSGPRPGGFGGPGSGGPGGFRGPGGPRPGGPPREGGAGPSRPWTPRPPRPGTMPPPEEMPQEDRRRFGVKKKKPTTPDGERAPKLRLREEEEDRAGNWRQWMDEYSDEDEAVDNVEDLENEDAGGSGHAADAEGAEGAEDADKADPADRADRADARGEADEADEGEEDSRGKG